MKNYQFTYREMIINEFLDKGYVYSTLIFYDEVRDTKKFSNLKENPVTKKKIPNYLRF